MKEKRQLTPLKIVDNYIMKCNGIAIAVILYEQEEWPNLIHACNTFDELLIAAKNVMDCEPDGPVFDKTVKGVLVNKLRTAILKAEGHTPIVNIEHEAWLAGQTKDIKPVG